jgi:beta-lactamase superfamily II metal-dependent hydrolase
VIVLDAGQGDATLVVFPDGSLMLVDCGCKKNATIVTPEIWAVLGPYLTANQLSLRALVLTHPDGDHYNLVEELIVKHNVKVGTLLYGGRESDYGGLIARIDAQKRRGIDAGTQDMQQGYYNPNPDTDLSNLIAQGNPYNVEVRILAANAGSSMIKKEANPNSVVLVLTYHDINIFLMGDSTIETELFILGWSAQTSTLNQLLTGRKTMLKAGHHGSNTSSGSGWIKTIMPEVVFISSDTRTFGGGVSLPRLEVVQNILSWGRIVDFGAGFSHYYVQYNAFSQRHEQKETTRAIYTTLNLLRFTDAFNFKADGTSWCYTVGLSTQERTVHVTPFCGWEKVKLPSD